MIFNLNQQPFDSFDSAAKMRDVLIKETENRYQVELFEPGNEAAGFVIKRTPQPSVNDTGYPENMNAKTGTMTNKVYHPALASYLLYFPLAILALLLTLFAVELWSVILSVLDIKGLPVWIDAGLLIHSTQIIGAAGVSWIVSAVLINYYGTSLVIDSHGLTFKQGILTRDVTHIRFAEIRTVGLRQGLLDRLLNMGILEFAASGTDDVDIRFINIADPTGVKAEIAALIEQQTQT